MLNIGDIVIEKDIDRDLGLVVDHYTDPYDGYVYIWFSGSATSLAIFATSYHPVWRLYAELSSIPPKPKTFLTFS